LSGRAADQNPLLKDDHVSEGISIPFKDAEIIANAGEPVGDPKVRGYSGSSSGYGPANGTAAYFHPTFHLSAIFQAQSAHRLKFVVELASKWTELVHADDYEITLTDDRGHVFRPTEVQNGRAHAVFSAMMVSRSDVVGMTVNTPGGTYVITHPEDGSLDVKQMFAAKSMLWFEGDGLLTDSTQSLTLHLRNSKRKVDFIWQFQGT
jgi:hypothetical protein